MRTSILKLILTTVSFSISVSLFLVIVHELFSEKEYDFDNTVLHYVTTQPHSRGVSSVMVILSSFASGNFLTFCYLGLFLFYAVFRKRLRLALYILSTGLTGLLVNTLLKLLFRRQRPADPLIAPPNDFGFPSGHSTAAFIFYGLLIYLFWRSRLPTALKHILSGSLILFSVAIGFSRIYLRVHYPTDVLAGFCVGFAWLSLSIFLYGNWNGTIHDKHHPH